jgi:hypothetical protein
MKCGDVFSDNGQVLLSVSDVLQVSPLSRNSVVRFIELKFLMLRD